MTRVPENLSETAELKWVNALLRLNSIEIVQLLTDRWKHVVTAGFREMALMIQAGRPHSVVTADGIAWLKVFVSKYISMDKRIQTFALYVRRPFSHDEAAACLEPFELCAGVRRDMISFIQDFGGLRDCEPGHAGSFLQPPLVDSVGVWCEGSDVGEVAGFPIFYGAANGDLLGVYPDGRTGWHCTEDLHIGCPVRPFANDIPDTVFKWVNANDWVDGCIYFDDAWSVGE